MERAPLTGFREVLREARLAPHWRWWCRPAGPAVRAGESGSPTFGVSPASFVPGPGQSLVVHLWPPGDGAVCGQRSPDRGLMTDCGLESRP